MYRTVCASKDFAQFSALIPACGDLREIGRAAWRERMLCGVVVSGGVGLYIKKKVQL